jgi:hypothetical protein
MKEIDFLIDFTQWANHVKKDREMTIIIDLMKEHLIPSIVKNMISKEMYGCFLLY